MTWFLVVLVHGWPINDAASMSAKHYRTQTECLDDARPRTAALASIGAHGYYGCMYRGEPARELDRSYLGRF